MDNILKLRWYLFLKFQSNISKLPPAVATLKFKIFHSHFIALVLCRDCWNFQQFSSFKNYDWKIHQSKIVAITTNNLPSPLALVELSVWNFITLCNNNNCKCYKNNLACTDMCKCIGRQNEGGKENYKFDKNNEYDSAKEDCQ